MSVVTTKEIYDKLLEKNSVINGEVVNSLGQHEGINLNIASDVSFTNVKTEYITAEREDGFLENVSFQNVSVTEQWFIEFQSFENVTMENLDVSYINWDYMNISNSEFSDVRAAGSSFANIDFENTKLQNNDFRNTYLIDVTFTDSEIANTHFDNSTMHGVIFDNVKFKNINFTNLRDNDSLSFRNCEFENCQIELSKLVDLNIDNKSKMNIENARSSVTSVNDLLEKIIERNENLFNPLEKASLKYDPTYSNRYEVTFHHLENDTTYVATFEYQELTLIQPFDETVYIGLQKGENENVLLDSTVEIISVENPLLKDLDRYNTIHEEYLSNYHITSNDISNKFKTMSITDDLKEISELIKQHKVIQELDFDTRDRIISELIDLQIDVMNENDSDLTALHRSELDAALTDKFEDVNRIKYINSTEKCLNAIENIIINTPESLNTFGLKSELELNRFKNPVNLQTSMELFSNTLSNFESYKSIVKGQITDKVQQVRHYLDMASDISRYLSESFDSQQNKRLTPFVEKAIEKAQGIALEIGIVKSQSQDTLPLSEKALILKSSLDEWQREQNNSKEQNQNNSKEEQIVTRTNEMELSR